MTDDNEIDSPPPEEYLRDPFGFAITVGKDKLLQLLHERHSGRRYEELDLKTRLIKRLT